MSTYSRKWAITAISITIAALTAIIIRYPSQNLDGRVRSATEAPSQSSAVREVMGQVESPEFNNEGQPAAAYYPTLRFVDENGFPLDVRAAIDTASGRVTVEQVSDGLYCPTEKINVGRHIIEVWTPGSGQYWKTQVHLTADETTVVRLTRGSGSLSIALMADEEPYQGVYEYSLQEEHHSLAFPHASTDLGLFALTHASDRLSLTGGPEDWCIGSGPTLEISKSRSAWQKLRVQTPDGLVGQAWLSPTAPTETSVLHLREQDVARMSVAWGGISAPSGMQLDCYEVWSHTMSEWQGVHIQESIAEVIGYTQNIGPCFVLWRDAARSGLPASFLLMTNPEQIGRFNASIAGHSGANLEFKKYEDVPWKVHVPKQYGAARHIEFWITVPQADGKHIRLFEIGRRALDGSSEYILSNIIGEPEVQVRLANEGSDTWLYVDRVKKTITLPDTRSVLGRVVSSLGKPLEGMRLAWCSSAEARSIRSFRDCFVTTDENGRFSFQVLTTDSGTVRLVTPGYQCQDVSVEANLMVDVEITAVRFSTARVQVSSTVELRAGILRAYPRSSHSKPTREQLVDIACPDGDPYSGYADIPLVYGEGTYLLTLAIPDVGVSCQWRAARLVGGKAVSLTMEPLEEKRILIIGSGDSALDIDCRWRNAGVTHVSRVRVKPGGTSIHVPSPGKAIEVKVFHKELNKTIGQEIGGPLDWVMWEWKGPAGALPTHIDLQTSTPIETTLAPGVGGSDIEIRVGEWSRRYALEKRRAIRAMVPRGARYEVRASGGMWASFRDLPEWIDALSYSAERRVAFTSSAQRFASKAEWRLVLRQGLEEWVFTPSSPSSLGVAAPVGASALGHLTNQSGETRRVTASVLAEGWLLVDLEQE